MAKHWLDRRTFLRGTLGSSAVCVGLPLLESMLDDNGGALASGEPLPLRFGTWFWGGGPKSKEFFFPAATGANWTPPPSLKGALESYPEIKPYLTFVSGGEHKFAGTGHHVSRSAALSASHDRRGRGFDGRGGPVLPSIDQVVASAWKGKTSLASLEISITSSSKMNFSRGWGNSTAFLEEGKRLPSQNDVQQVFNRLFGGGLPTQSDNRSTSARVQRSVLDTLRADAIALRGRVLASDRPRIEQWLDNLRTLEQRIMAPAAECLIPNRPTTVAGAEGKLKAMVDLLAVGLVCDATRVFSIEWSGSQSEFVYGNVNAPTGHHEVTHGDKGRKTNPIASYILTQFGYLVDKLRQTPDGPGVSLLDTLLLFNTTEYMNPAGHSLVPDHPMLIAGRARGRFRAGVHHAMRRGDKASRAMFTLLKALQLPLAGYGMRGRAGSQSGGGSGDNYTEEPLNELLI